jgi:pimeloyl-ACP methyl ester carboxylesterase
MTQKNNILKRSNKKPILWDAFYNEHGVQKPLVIFCHGYKGFKDWGAWDLVAKAFAEAGFFFVKFNFSHNGGTMDQPIDFPDLEAFSENNYSKELEDLDDLINYLHASENSFAKNIALNNTILIGHSRGGGIATIKASKDERIAQLVTWASVSDFGKRMGTAEELEQWEADGVKYVENGRTKQQMPHKYQFYEDFIANESCLNIETSARKIRIPHLIVHAKEDPSVSFSEALSLHKFNPQSELVSITDSDHVFGASHPLNNKDLPAKLRTVVDKTIDYIDIHMKGA